MCLRGSNLHHALFVEAPAVGIKAFSLHGDIIAALLQNRCSADPNVAFVTTPSGLHYPFQTLHTTLRTCVCSTVPGFHLF